MQGEPGLPYASGVLKSAEIDCCAGIANAPRFDRLRNNLSSKLSSMPASRKEAGTDPTCRPGLPEYQLSGTCIKGNHHAIIETGKKEPEP